jgi:3-oxoacyl-[acyl-carrier-protein] synthase II
MADSGTHRVVVTGLGVINPVGLSVKSMWESVVSGRSGIDYISTFDTSPFNTKVAGEIRNFDPVQFADRKTVRHMDRFAQFALAASLQAVEASKLTINGKNAEDVGVIIGSSVCGLLSVCEQLQVLSVTGPSRVSPALAPRMCGDAGAVQVSLALGAKGLSYSPSSACSSGADAIGQAADIIRRGGAKVMIAGGTESPIIPLVLAAFSSLKVLSIRNDDPQEACRPFDAGRDGFVLGEGSGIMVLEDAEYAIQRGAPILAELSGYGSTSDAYHMVQPSPVADGAIKAIRIALKNANLSTDDIDYIGAHGTATVLNDKTETHAIKTVFGERAKRIPITASKSIFGHSLGASGSTQALITVMALKYGIAPPTLNLTDPDPDCDLDYVPLKARPVNIRNAMCNTFGFGGHNSVLVFRHFETN